MASSFSFGFGPQDWLKMTNPTKPTQPITQMGTMSNTGTTMPTGGPITSPQSLYGQKQGNPTPQPLGGQANQNPFQVTNPAFNIAPPKIANPVQTPQPTMTMRGAPVPSMQADAAQAAPATMTMRTNPVPSMQADTPAAQPTIQAPQPVAPQVQETPMDVATPMPGASQPITFQDNGPQNQDVPTTQPNTAPKPDMVNATTQPSVTAPVKTEPSLDDNMAMYEKIAADWANGVVDDKVFRTTANRAIMQMGLNNQAETDALQMRINQDPALKGQGAGAALLSIMAANHNFSADQMFGQLAQSAQEKILDMQKYGLQQGVQINQMRRENDYRKLGLLQDAGDFAGAASLAAKIADFPGVTISPTGFAAARSRNMEDAQSLIAAGNYQGGAAKLSAVTGQPVDANALRNRDPAYWVEAQRKIDNGDFEGASRDFVQGGVNVTADDLRAQSPEQQTRWTNTLDGIKALASVKPDEATYQLDMLMKNPAAAKYLGFTAGMKAADLIQAIVTGKYQADQDMRAGLQTEINLKAKSNASFSQALVDYKAMGPAVLEGFTQSGKKMAGSDLAAFNQARSALGMSSVHNQDGNIVDTNGHVLMDEDFAETAIAADYISRKDTLNKKPWQVAYDTLMDPNGPMREKILSIPGGEASVKETLMMTYLGGGYKLDPTTQTLVPDYTGGMPWENPNTAHIFHNWPLAVFGADGTIQGKYDLGGEMYGDKVGDTPIQKMPDDEALDDAFAQYRYNKGTLSAPEWYFATAGGTRPEDKTKIPADLPKTNMTDVGTTTTPTTETTPKAGTGDALTAASTKVDEIVGRLPAKVDATNVKALLEEAAKGTATKSNIANKLGGYPGAEAAHIFRNGDAAYMNDAAHTPTQEAKDFLAYNNMVEMGVPDKDAADLLVQTIGAERFAKAYKMLTGKEHLIYNSMDLMIAGVEAAEKGT